MTPTDRQSQSNASSAREAQRRIEERDRPFWEAAFCAALGGLCATTYKPGDLIARAEVHAEAALTARNARWPGREDSDG